MLFEFETLFCTRLENVSNFHIILFSGCLTLVETKCDFYDALSTISDKVSGVHFAGDVAVITHPDHPIDWTKFNVLVTLDF